MSRVSESLRKNHTFLSLNYSKCVVLFLGLVGGWQVPGPGQTDDSRSNTSRPPNIILCMADDQGWGDVGFNGHPFLKTPSLDRMAKEGIQFNRWYAAAPVCSPTRGSCLTGRHPFRYGIYTANKGHFKRGEIGLQEILKTEGYVTGHFGKWHLGTLTTAIKDANRGKPGNQQDYAPPWDHGFDVCFSTESKVPTFDPMKNPGAASKAVKKGVAKGSAYGTYYWTGEGQRVPDHELEGDDSMLIVKQAVRFMKRANAEGKPFFAVVWFHAPHLPVVADQAHRDLYPDHPFGLYGQHYAGCISAIDDAMGTLRGELEQMGEYDNTMLWYCADNGPEGQAKSAPGTAGTFRGRKRSLYEGGVRVPAFLVWPNRVTSSRKTDFPAVTSDYFPTILDVLDVKLPERPYDGVSLLPLIEGKSTERNRPIGFQSKNVATWNGEKLKLVITDSSKNKKNGNRKTGGAPKVELFDLINDPAESNNIANKHPDVVREMTAQLNSWRESCRKSDRGEDY